MPGGAESNRDDVIGRLCNMRVVVVGLVRDWRR